jgi:ABC-2 type transport system ATP-binding protein
VETEHVVVVRDLVKRYKKLEALRGITLNVGRGEIFGVLGPNGAGKTTLIKALVGSSRPSAGFISVMGANPFAQAAEVRHKIGYMPQAPALYEDLSPRNNLRFFGRAHGVQALERRIDDVLDLIGLRARERDAVYGFSGGMKQRLSLACALLHAPRVLFLDEPTAGVDPKLREVFWQHFRDLASSGVTLIVSTHQMDEALFCERLAVLRAGTVLACETPAELLRRGRTRVRLWRDNQVDPVGSTTLENYSTELPRLLQRSGLDHTISRIELEHDTLETIVLAMIHASEAVDARSAPESSVAHA